MKLKAVPWDVALRNSIAMTTVHAHTVSPVGASATGRCQPRESNHPSDIPVRNGHDVSAMPPIVNPSV